MFAGDLSSEELCENLSVLYKIPVVPGKTLLFFDEIQSCIPAISSLRFFYEKKRKMLIFDTGIFLNLLGLEISDVLFSDDFNLVNKGSLAELFAGLEIVKAESCFSQPQLVYWQREALNSNAEIDYLVQSGDLVIPVEVKAGTKGSMQSMFLFLEEKHRPWGIRTSLENFSSYDKIRVCPLYALRENVKGGASHL